MSAIIPETIRTSNTVLLFLQQNRETIGAFVPQVVLQLLTYLGTIPIKSYQDDIPLEHLYTIFEHGDLLGMFEEQGNAARHTLQAQYVLKTDHFDTTLMLKLLFGPDLSSELRKCAEDMAGEQDCEQFNVLLHQALAKDGRPFDESVRFCFYRS